MKARLSFKLFLWLLSSQLCAMDPIKSAVKLSAEEVGKSVADYKDPITDAIAARVKNGQPSLFKSLSAENLQTTISNIYAKDPEFSVQHKRVETLVLDGLDFAQKAKTIGDICKMFSHSKDYVDGELYLFIYDEKGVCWTHGDEQDRVWKNLWELRDRFGAPIVQNIIEMARSGGGWISYEWRNAPKLAFIKGFKKGDVFYALGCGYYPHAKRAFCMSAVQGAVALFNQMVNKDNKPLTDVWSIIQYPGGRFVYGDIDVTVVDKAGLIFVDSIESPPIGSSIFSLKDDDGRIIYKEVIHTLLNDKNNEGRWFYFKKDGSELRKFAQKVIHNQTGNIFIIDADYYPGITGDDALKFVNKAYAFMKTAGKTTAALEFTERRLSEFQSTFGYLYLVVYSYNSAAENSLKKQAGIQATNHIAERESIKSMAGASEKEEIICIAHGANEKLVGRNDWDTVDQDGDFYVREIVTKAIELRDSPKQEGAWVNARLRNTFASIYLKPINLGGQENFVITTILYPSGREAIMKLLVQSASTYLRSSNVSLDQAFNAFNLPFGEFVRGDLSIFALDLTGLCYVWETVSRLIWKDLSNVVDDEGKQFVKEMIQKSTGGRTTIKYKQNNRSKTAYIIPVEKDGNQFIVGSSVYIDDVQKQPTQISTKGNVVRVVPTTTKSVPKKSTTVTVIPVA